MIEAYSFILTIFSCIFLMTLMNNELYYPLTPHFICILSLNGMHWITFLEAMHVHTGISGMCQALNHGAGITIFNGSLLKGTGFYFYFYY